METLVKKVEFSLTSVYYKAETWAEVVQKLIPWSKEFIKKSWGLDIDPVALDGWEILGGMGYDSERIILLVYESPRFSTLKINFMLSGFDPGVVSVEGFNLDWVLPLMNLSRFETLEEAELWLSENRGFYNPSWDSFIKKVSNGSV